MKSARESTRSPRRDQSWTVASKVRSRVARSLCGSAKARLPPTVPTLHTRAFATCRATPASRGRRSRTSAEVSTARWGTAAPMVIVPSAPGASASRPGTRLTSIRWRGRSSPSFIRSSSSVPLRTPSSGRGECPGTRAVPPGRPPGARRQARALASFCTGKCPAPLLQPRRASPPRARRRPISAASPRARSCTGRSRRIWTDSWRPPRGTRAPDCRRSSPGSCAPTCAAESWSRGAFTCGVSAVRTRWWWGFRARGGASARRVGAGA